MNKTYLKAIGSVILSIFGLISCGKEKAQQDHFSIPKPSFKRRGQMISIEKSQFNQADFGLNDELVIVPSGAQTFFFNVTCDLGDESFRKTLVTAPRTKFSLLALLPEELLYKNETAQPVYCDFAVNAVNKIGSTHDFAIRRIKVLPGYSARKVGLSLDFFNQHQVTYVEELKADETYVHFYQSFGSAKMLCSDMTADVRFDSVFISMSKFLGTAKKIKNSPARSTQVCQIYEYMGNELISMSTRFTLHSSSPAPTVIYTSNEAVLPAKSKTIELYAVKVKNETLEDMHFQMPIGSKFKINIKWWFGQHLGDILPSYQFYEAKTVTSMWFSENASVQNNFGQYQITVPPKNELLIRFTIRPSENCESSTSIFKKPAKSLVTIEQFPKINQVDFFGEGQEVLREFALVKDSTIESNKTLDAKNMRKSNLPIECN